MSLQVLLLQVLLLQVLLLQVLLPLLRAAWVLVDLVVGLQDQVEDRDLLGHRDLVALLLVQA